MELQPGKYYPIVRQIPDPNDTATYYVRAVVRNALTGSTIDTLNLTDAGSGRHAKSWQVEANVPDDGMWVTITTTVYTDSGYTTKSAIYSEELEQYLIIPRAQSFGGGGGGGTVSYERIQDLFEQSLRKFDKGDGALKVVEELIRQFKSDIEGKIDADGAERNERLLAIEDALRGIPTTDLSPVLERIAMIPQTDLGPLAEAVKRVHDKVPEPFDYKELVSMLHADMFDAMEKRVLEAVRSLKAADRAAMKDALATLNAKRTDYLTSVTDFFDISKELVATDVDSPKKPVTVRSLIRNARTTKV